jgi:hypothetical protein
MIKTVLIIFAVFGLTSIILREWSTTDKPPQESFQVVDHYKGCDVIRYTPPGRATSEFFLKCDPEPAEELA